MNRLKQWLLKHALNFATTRFGGWFFTTFIPPIDRPLLRLSKGRISLAGLAAPILLLTTTGRKTGRPRSVPLLYVEGVHELVVVGSRGGRKDHADWYRNLLANPMVQVTIRGATAEYEATEVTDDTRERWWDQFLDFHPGFATYEARLDRHIPVISLKATQTESFEDRDHP